MEYFWTNTIWYVLLGVITIFELGFIMVTAKNKRLVFAFYLTLSGITLTFETIILIFFKAYVYYPKLLKNPPNPFDDILAGNLFSQFSIAATVLLVAVFNLNWIWFIAFALIYGAIEEFFLYIGIYEHYWYRTWMTITILPFAFWSGKYLYKKIQQRITPIFYYSYILCAQFPLVIILLSWPLMLLRLRTFNYYFLPDPSMSPYLLALIYFSLLVLPLMFLHFHKVRCSWQAIVITFLYLISYSGYKAGLIWIREGWFFVVTTLSIFWVYASIYIVDWLYGFKLLRPK